MIIYLPTEETLPSVLLGLAVFDLNYLVTYIWTCIPALDIMEEDTILWYLADSSKFICIIFTHTGFCELTNPATVTQNFAQWRHLHIVFANISPRQSFQLDDKVIRHAASVVLQIRVQKNVGMCLMFFDR